MERSDLNESANLVLVLEKDPRFRQDIEEALREVAPELKVLAFSQAAEFFKWTSREPRTLTAGATSETEKVVMVVGAKDLLGANERVQFRNVPQQLRSTGRADPQGPLPLILTAHGGAEFHLAEVLDGAWENVLLKPFDKDILRQHLRIALSGQQPPSEFTVYNLKTNAQIEILKPVPVESISELGFVTRSDRDVPLGRAAKYYGHIFEWQNRRSITAVTWSCQTHPRQATMKQVRLDFFGVPKEQLLDIRGRLPKSAVNQAAEWIPPRHGTSADILVVGDPSPPGAELSGAIERFFPTAKVVAVSSLLHHKDPLPASLAAILVGTEIATETLRDPRLQAASKSAAIFLIADKPRTDASLRELSSFAKDVFILPAERNFVVKRLAQAIPALRSDQVLEVKGAPASEIIEAGNPVEITSMSEAGLILRYERELPRGEFRRFVLWQPVEAGLPVLTGRCHFSQADPSQKDRWLNHFSFYAVSDLQLKHIRLWMLENYISGKQKGS